MWSRRPAAGLSRSGSAPTTILGNGFVGAAPGCGALAKRILSAVSAHNICSAVRARTFSPISPWATAATRSTAFDPAKDVIDLSHIDADITTAGVQNFTFIGSAPFSGGAQVRYQLNPTKNTTTVQAALAGDPTADFTITLAGTCPAYRRQFRAHAVSVLGRLGEWRGVDLHQGSDGCRRADRIRIFERSG